jgi:AmmeMemoRadiSam system protein B
MTPPNSAIRVRPSLVVRPPAVAGLFYPAAASELERLVRHQLDEASGPGPARVALPTAILVPHAGLVYSGKVAAAAWHLLASASPVDELTVVILGTNHSAVWFDGIGVWDSGGWKTPLGLVGIDSELAEQIALLGAPFVIDLEAHAEEHSIEVQLPFIQVVAPAARIVPLAVSAGIGTLARDAGRRLGQLIAQRRGDGSRIVLAISTDMAHYPSARNAEHVTQALLPALMALDPASLGECEAALASKGIPGLACGMCGIQPAVIGLSALRELGRPGGVVTASATSADQGGPASRTVGYLALAFG